MKDYTYDEKRTFHVARKERLEKKMGKGLTTEEYKQFINSFGFLVGADYEQSKESDDIRKAVIRGQNAYRFNKKVNKK